MIRWEIIILFGLVVLDVLMTYILMYNIKEKLKVKNYFQWERNPIVKYFVTRYGLHKGMRISFLFVCALWVFIIMYFNVRTNWFDFSRIIFAAIGIYMMMNTIHFYTLTDVLKQVKDYGNKRSNAKIR